MPRKPSEKQTLAPIPEKPEHLSDQSEFQKHQNSKTPEQRKKRSPKTYSFRKSYFFRRQLQQRTSVVTIPNSKDKQNSASSLAVQSSSNVNFLRVHWRVAACDAISVAKCIDRLPIHLTPNDDQTPQIPLLRPSINSNSQIKRTELVSVFEVDQEKLQCKRNYAHNCISPISIIKFMADYKKTSLSSKNGRSLTSGGSMSSLNSTSSLLYASSSSFQRHSTTLSPNITLSSSCRTGSRLSNNNSLTKSVKRKSDDDETLSSNSSSDSINPGTPTKVISCTSKQRQVFPKDDFYVCTVEDRDYFIQKQATVGAPLFSTYHLTPDQNNLANAIRIELRVSSVNWHNQVKFYSKLFNMESKSTNSNVASFALPLQDYQEQVEFSLLKTDKSKMENLCFCRQAVTLELWMKQTQNLKGFLKLPGMVKQSKSTKGYYKLKDLDGNILKLRVGIQHGNGKVSSSSSGIGSLCSLTNSVSVNSDVHSLGQQIQPSTVNAKVPVPELSRVYDIPRRCNFQALLASPLTRTPRSSRRKTIGESLRNASLLARGSEPIMKQHLEMLHKQESKDNKSSDKIEKLARLVSEKNVKTRRSLALGKNFSSSRLENAMAVYCSSPSTRKMAIV